ncbi:MULTISPECIES: replication initiation factor domain-containing protein [Stenotrophomonas]|uniref:replication initiation factor domain-containing protein n=1 Tax=Stenotrophomonas TaxID=40323 RepID=UPI001CF34513|nr:MULTISPECIES: replication initiation factor domain-containing protein [Stenotrophomonas]MCA7024790.1 replication initiation factor domain-containing protein [Stenotrophomonas acidaminiphila]MCE4074452.1 replication initiation factor domain-containing protein [Stenotrophomonas acidaminiphila]
MLDVPPSISSRERAFWSRAGAIEHPFSPAEPCNQQDAAGPAEPAGPSSNTGQKSPKGSSLTAPIIDFCTLVLDSEKAIRLFRKMHASDVLAYVFGTAGSIVCGPITEKLWNFRYEYSATLIDETSSVCGKIGLTAKGEYCISLTGQGCQHVPNWRYVERVAQDLDAHLTRLDIAIDDLTGETFDIHRFHDLYLNGEFTMNGRPPEGRWVDDMGSDKGCSLYIGQKGHKQLNVYEKGKQLGDPESGHTRCELRLYAKRLDLPLDALSNPGKYFGAAYPMLAEFVIGECERIDLKRQMVNASAKAMLRFLYNQAGTALQLVLESLGEENGVALIKQYIARQGRPGRYKSFVGDLHGFVRTQLSEYVDAAA